MGVFSWIYSDTNIPLLIGKEAFVPTPDGDILYEHNYNGYGTFAGCDIYELVAMWNREYLAEHPEHIIPSNQKRICDHPWYAIYRDLSIDFSDIICRCQEQKLVSDFFETRSIGIAIASYDEDNSALKRPIKICRYKNNAVYDELNPSKFDLYQGI